MPDSNVRRLEFQRTPLPNLSYVLFEFSLSRISISTPNAITIAGCLCCRFNIAKYGFFARVFGRNLFRAIRKVYRILRTAFFGPPGTSKLLWTSVKISIYLNVKFGFSFLLLPGFAHPNNSPRKLSHWSYAQ